MINDPKRILSETANFYEKLYSKNDLVTNENYDFFFSNNIPKLSAEENTQINKSLSSIELYNALKTMKDNKTPGSDGIKRVLYNVLEYNSQHSP